VLDYDRLMFWERAGADDWEAKLTMQVWLHWGGWQYAEARR
jgi:hypothetical protein